MGLEENIGKVKYYHEMGDVFKVKVLDAKEKTYEKSEGEEYKLKVLGTTGKNFIINEEARAKIGQVFTVWRAKDAGAYVGWSLSDD